MEVSLLNFHEQQSDPHATGVIEHVHVLNGALLVYFDNAWHELQAGQSLRFFADQPHTYKARSEYTVFHNIICY